MFFAGNLLKLTEICTSKYRDKHIFQEAKRHFSAAKKMKQTPDKNITTRTNYEFNQIRSILATANNTGGPE